MKELLSFIAICAWISGITIAKGVASVLIACLFPPYSWYLVNEIQKESR
jgi:hypothetical protein